MRASAIAAACLWMTDHSFKPHPFFSDHRNGFAVKILEYHTTSKESNLEIGPPSAPNMKFINIRDTCPLQFCRSNFFSADSSTTGRYK